MRARKTPLRPTWGPPPRRGSRRPYSVHLTKLDNAGYICWRIRHFMNGLGALEDTYDRYVNKPVDILILYLAFLLCPVATIQADPQAGMA